MVIIPESLKAYHAAIEKILSWMPDWLHQDDFDRLAWKDRLTVGGVIGYERDTPILTAGLFHGPQQGALQLLKIMIDEGLAEQRGESDGAIYYRAKT